jgi:membrane protein YdbS with pleckstrin-like domain
MDERKEIALAEYKEVLTQFRTLTDIRFKLLTYLPLGTVAAAVFVSPTNNLVKQSAIPAFAFVVTLCIATYDKRNDQHYDELVSRAAELERELQIEHGSFSDRPKSWLKYGFVKV